VFFLYTLSPPPPPLLLLLLLLAAIVYSAVSARSLILYSLKEVPSDTLW